MNNLLALRPVEYSLLFKNRLICVASMSFLASIEGVRGLGHDLYEVGAVSEQIELTAEALARRLRVDVVEQLVSYWPRYRWKLCRLP